MPIHDWTRVEAGTFHHFHGLWITHLSEGLNNGLLPDDFYAMSEQVAGGFVADVLTLEARDSRKPRKPVSLDDSADDGGAVAVAVAPPKVQRKLPLDADNFYRTKQRRITIRHVSDHRVIALLEIVSPGNKDRERSLNTFVKKAWDAMDQGLHLMIIDVFPPSKFDPRGIHGAIMEYTSSQNYDLPTDMPLTFASYAVNGLREAYINHAKVGDPLPVMPLFFDPEWYVNVPLEESYQQAWRGMPSVWREVLERV